MLNLLEPGNRLREIPKEYYAVVLGDMTAVRGFPDQACRRWFRPGSLIGTQSVKPEHEQGKGSRHD